jgi:NAD(P)-dependent dehydrogenase (short-subunit alcohol dehydrogenase family)
LRGLFIQSGYFHTKPKCNCWRSIGVIVTFQNTDLQSETGDEEAFLVSGWGKDGRAEADLFVSRRSDNSLKWRGWPGLGPYATAKAGLHGLSRTLAVELGPANILSNVVMPGAVMTERTQQHISDEQREQIKQHTPTRQLTMPEDVAALIVFLGSPVNRQITGEIIRITSGR